LYNRAANIVRPDELDVVDLRDGDEPVALDET
jgi:hypothetical protein